MVLQLAHLVFQRIRQKGLADDQHIGRFPNDPFPEVLPRSWHFDQDVRPRQNLLELLASGMRIEEIIEDHPDLERDDLLAALEFGALAASQRRVVPFGAE